MKKIISIVALTAMCFLGGASVSQAWMFDIQQGAAVNSYDINFIAGPDTVVFDGYQLIFDYSGANLISGVETPPAPLFALFGPYNDTGSMVDFTAATFASGPTLSVDWTLANFMFDGPATISWNHMNPSFLVTLAGVEMTGADLNAAGNLANTSAVPIPGAVWLLGSGLAGMVAMRRKKK